MPFLDLTLKVIFQKLRKEDTRKNEEIHVSVPYCLTRLI